MCFTQESPRSVANTLLPNWWPSSVRRKSGFQYDLINSWRNKLLVCAAVVLHLAIDILNFNWRSLTTMTNVFSFSSHSRGATLSIAKRSKGPDALCTRFDRFVSAFPTPRACCKCSYRQRDVIWHVRTEKYFLHCVLLASLTWMYSSWLTSLCTEKALSER